MLAMLIIFFATLMAFWLYRQMSAWQHSNSQTKLRVGQRVQREKTKKMPPETVKGGIRKPWGW